MNDEDDMNVPKETINREIQRIYDRDGSVKASVVVAEAKPKNAPLHPKFEWRDKVAAEQYRLEQARKIIRVARIIENNVPTQLVHVPRVETSDAPVGEGAGSTREGYYKSPTVIARSIDEYELALTEALRRLSSAQNAVDALEAAARGKSGIEGETLARISLAVNALETAREALATH
jgi:hypothetical protein